MECWVIWQLAVFDGGGYGETTKENEYQILWVDGCTVQGERNREADAKFYENESWGYNKGKGEKKKRLHSGDRFFLKNELTLENKICHLKDIFRLLPTNHKKRKLLSMQPFQRVFFEKALTHITTLMSTQ